MWVTFECQRGAGVVVPICLLALRKINVECNGWSGGSMNTVEWYSGKRALVLGGAGFVGTNLALALRGAGADVTVVDDLSARSPINTMEVLQAAGVEVLPANMLQVCEMGGPWDVMFHLACRKKFEEVNLSTYCQHHLVQWDAVLGDVCKRDAVGTVVYTSTGSVWEGKFKHGVMVTKASDDVEPLSDYAITKLAAEHVLCRYAEQYGINAHTLRLFNVVGPYQDYVRGGFVARWCKAAYDGGLLPITGNGKQVRTLTWVGDVVNACMQAGAESGVTTRIVSSHDPRRLTEVAGWFAEHTPCAGFAFNGPNDALNVRTSGERTGLVQLVELLQRTWTWYKEYFDANR